MDQGLRERREKASSETLSKYVRGSLADMREIIKLSVDNLKRFLTAHSVNETIVSTKDAKLMSDILANIHRVVQLENGKPTNITETRAVSQEELHEHLRQAIEDLKRVDPMVSYNDNDGTDPKIN